MGIVWPLLQSHTTQYLLKFPILVPLGGEHHQLRLGAASSPHGSSKLSRAGPLQLGKTEQESHPLVVALAKPVRGGKLHTCFSSIGGPS